MADNHRNKRLRRLSTEEDTSASESWTAVKSNTNQNGASTTNTGRPRRAAAMASSTSVTVERASPEERTSIRLTVKAPPNKLRQVTQGRPTRNAGTRAAARRRPIVEESTSDEEDEDDIEEDQLDDDEDDEDDEPAGDDDDEEMADVEEDEVEEDEDEDAEGDEDDEMPDLPPPLPTFQIPPAHPLSMAPKITKTAPPPAAKSKAVQPDSDDEELSSLDSLEDEDPVEDDEEEEEEGGEEDASGEEDIEGVGLDDELPASDDDSELGSRGDTPDLTKLTRRQRADYDPSEMMALSNEAQKKKHLTAEEHAMRRAEMARRRKNLSEKRNEEEKLSTIDRLLNKQEPKRRRKNAAADPYEGIDEEGFEGPKAPAAFVRYIQTEEGSRLLVPQEWIEAPAGEVFSTSIRPLHNVPPFRGKLIEEIS